MIFKKDNLKLGIILGLFGPVIGLVVIYFIKFSSFTFHAKPAAGKSDHWFGPTNKDVPSYLKVAVNKYFFRTSTFVLPKNPCKFTGE